MQIYMYYHMDCITEEEVKQIQQFFEARHMSVMVEGLSVSIESDESVKEHYEIEDETTHVKVAIKDWEEIAPVLGREFTVDGTVDTSFVAGEYMDFRLEYLGDAFAAMYSENE